VAFGMLAALLLARLMSSLLFGVGATDAFTLIAAGVLLMAVAAVACFVPARRASRLQPAVVLRNE
jgi:putative ABC transport system permease protein